MITFIFTVGPDHVEEFDRLFDSHAEWIEQTHHREGELALLSYNVAKGPELSNSLDPGSAQTDNTCYVLSEIYESPAGLADHWKQAGESWKDFSGFVEAAGKVKIAVLHGAPVVYSLW